MVQIDNSQTIRVSVGDDVKFPLFVNTGSKLNPVRYEFVAGSEDKIYFYIIYPNDSYENGLMTLEFSCTTDTINENGDFIISIPGDITTQLGCGKFEYIIRGYLDIDNEKQYVTITNPHEFWICRSTDDDSEEVDDADRYFVYGELNYFVKLQNSISYKNISGVRVQNITVEENGTSKTYKILVVDE